MWKPSDTVVYRFDWEDEIEPDELPILPPKPPRDWPIPRVGDFLRYPDDEGGINNLEAVVTKVVWHYSNPFVLIYIRPVVDDPITEYWRNVAEYWRNDNQ